MRWKWVGFAVILTVCMSLLAPSGHSRAADHSVRVTLPDFVVSLNGHKVENQHREYPLLVYQDITYFPMTWYDTRLLGLEANWSHDDGLTITQSQVTSSYLSYESERHNANSYRAEVPAATVTIGGKTIDNSKEPYPLLSFRDVTYFPLTWRFAHDEFGWDYQWSETEGLAITSHNPQLHTLDLPSFAGDNDVALFKGYYYYVETTDDTNHVYRAPVQRPTDKEEIYSYPVLTYQGLQKSISFQIRDHTLWFTYHLGGATMGSDYYVKISDDGKAELLHSGHLNFRETPYGTLIVRLGAWAFEGGNLFLLPPGQEEPIQKGSREWMYYAVTFNGSSYGPSHAASQISIIGDDAYMVASRNPSDANHIYSINLKTDKTEKIATSEVKWFRIIDNKLFYVKDEDETLYSSALDGSGETKLSDRAVSWFDSIDGNVYYTTKKEAYQYELYQAVPNGDDPLVWATPVADARVLNGRLVCRFTEDDEYGAVLLDGSGRLQLRVADPVTRILSSDEGIMLLSSRDSSIKFIK